MRRRSFHYSAAMGQNVREHAKAELDGLTKEEIEAERAARLGKARAALKAALERLAKGERARRHHSPSQYEPDLP